VRKLRSKLHKQSPGWGYIHTHFGVGYRFEPEPGAPEDAELTVPAQPADEVAAAEEPAQPRVSNPG
jgi:hypothetical protein